MFLGDTTLTGGEVAERISQYVQAFEALGAGTGAAAAARAEPAGGAVHPRRRPDPGLPPHVAAPARLARRPRLRDQRRRDHHADHRPADVRRARARAAGEGARAQAGADHRAGARGAAPTSAVRPRPPRRRSSTPQPLAPRTLPPDHIVSITYTGGTTGKPKGVIGTAQAMTTMTQIQLAEWEWPENPAVPDVHAAVARRCGVLRADGDQGRRALRAVEVRPGRGAARPSRSRRSPRRCWCRRCSTR